MTSLGYALSSEEHAPRDLVRQRTLYSEYLRKQFISSVTEDAARKIFEAEVAKRREKLGLKAGQHVENRRLPRAPMADQSHLHLWYILLPQQLRESNLAGNTERINLWRALEWRDGHKKTSPSSGHV